MPSSNIQKRLTKSLENGANPILRIIDDSNLYEQLFSIISNFYEDNTSFQKDLPDLIKLSRQYDYRFIAIYLWALKNQKQDLLNAFDEMLQSKNSLNMNGKHLYKLSFRRFKDMCTEKVTKPNLSFVRSIKVALTPNFRGIKVYLYDEKYREVLVNFVNELKGSLSDFVNIQLDIGNRNAAIRQGDVKQWNLSDGTYVVSKRMESDKIEKFTREQTNYYKLVRRIPGLTFEINSSVKDGKISINIAAPFALVNDNYSGNVYALYKRYMGASLEEILYSTKSRAKRRRYLIHFKLIMEALLARGIWWGDMSPRNILVNESSGQLSYALIDFEKTKIFSNSVTKQKKVEYWRGQVFIEELCVVCPISEVLEVFQNYFNPKGWDFGSQKSIAFNLRPDIDALLTGRDVKHISLGEYNTLDRTILDIRKPSIDPKSCDYYYPGTIGFKIEHYLSSIGDDTASDYDRKTTEVLLAARKQKVFDKIAQMLLRKAINLETKLVELEFSALTKDGLPKLTSLPEKELRQLKKTLDVLYANLENHSVYSEFGKEDI